MASAPGIETRISRKGRKTYRASCWDPATGTFIRERFDSLTDARRWQRRVSVELRTTQVEAEMGKTPALPDLSRPVKAGTTYAISAKPYDGWVKVGRTAGETPAVRLASLQVGNPRLLVVRAVWPVDLETEFHRAYAAFRGRGEWFALPYRFVTAMGGVRAAADPLAALLERWPPDAVWDWAGTAPPDLGGRPIRTAPGALAKKFASRAGA